MARDNCGFITHVKGTDKFQAHKGFVAAVEAAKKQTKPTGVLSVCGGQVKRLALCSNGSCGSSSSGVGRVARARRKRRLGKATKARRRARRRG